MFGYCYLCSNEFSGLHYFCEDCSRIRTYIKLFNKRPIQILDNVLSRTEEKQKTLEMVEIKGEIQNKENQLQESLSEYPNKEKMLQELKKKVEHLKK